jgi:hypothetical protein
MRWSTLWTVTQTGTVVNERAAGIAGNLNPLTIDDFYTNALFAVRVTAQTNLPLTAVALYGAGNVNGFPAAGTLVEALWTTGGLPAPLGVNQGVLRIAAGRNRDALAPEVNIVLDQLRLVPQVLLLEYSTGAPGATPTLTFVVEICTVGRVPQGTA